MKRLAVLLLLSLSAATAAAQPAIVRPGARVRVDAPGFTAAPSAVTILTMTADTIVIGSPELAPLSIPRSAIRALEISRGKDRWLGTQRGTVRGIGLGLVFGALLSVAAEDCRGTGTTRTCSSLSGGERGQLIGFMAFGGAFYGSIIGAVAGSERWDDIEMPTRVGFQMRSGQPALAWSVAF